MQRAAAWALVMGTSLLAGGALFVAIAASGEPWSLVTTTSTCAAGLTTTVGGVPTRAPTRTVTIALRDGAMFTMERPPGEWTWVAHAENASFARVPPEQSGDAGSDESQASGGWCAHAPMTDTYRARGNGTLTLRSWQVA